MNILKKSISLCMAMLLLFSSGIEVLAGNSLDTALNKVNLFVKEEKGSQLLTWKGMIDPDNFAAAIIAYRSEDGNEYPAYCANPNRPGIEEMAAKNYDVDIDQLDTDPHVWGVITNGYPYKSSAELGVRNDYEAYYATKMAVWAVVHDNYSNLNDWKANGEQNAAVEKAMKELVAKGRSNDYVYSSWVSITPKTQIISEDSIDKNYLSQTYTIKSNVDIKNYQIVIDGTVPSGTKITDMNNAEKDSFEGDTSSFKVLVPKPEGESNIDFRVIAKTTLENKAVLFGLSHSANKQDYYVSPTKNHDGDSWVQFVYKDDGEIPEIPEEPENPDIPTASSGLQILKVRKGTTQGLAGAVFKITNTNGGVLGHYVTDTKGEISIPDMPVGSYFIDEIVPPFGYVLDENSHKDVVVKEDEPTVVTFANEEMAELEVLKVDADTGQKLAGAVIRVALDGGSDSHDIYTNASGIGTLTNLKSGTYTVTEITAPEGYILNDTPQSIKLESGKRATITFKNKAKPGLIIKKFDEDTALPLSGAEFSVAKKGGTVIYEGVTDRAGQIKIENLEPDWYTVTEIAAPKGYLIATESKDIKLEPNKVAEIKFDNRLRPSLQIQKIDSETGTPLEGAVFKLVKTEDKTESEYITDKTGTIVIHDLDEAVYTVTEIKSPNGYLLEEQHKDIALEWGKTKTLVFENKAKPKLEILKVDEATKEPLAGAKFRVTRTEGNTTSEYVTDETGRILIENLEAEIYTIEEIAAPVSYLLEEQHKDVELEWGKTKQVVFTNKKKPSLEILKIDEATKEPLKGAKFKVTRTEKDTTSEYVTDETGRILIENLEAEIYSAEEIIAPDGYLLEEQHKDIQLEWGKTKQLVFTNKKRPVLEIKKIDFKTKEPLAGAKFKVTKTEDKTVSEYMTDETGVITINKLDADTYTVEEITAPAGYLLDPQHKEIALEWGKTKTLIYEDCRKPTLIINKINGLTFKPIPNTTYKIEYEAQNGGLVPLGTYRTDKNGQIILPKVEVGWYVITETKAAPGFSTPSNPVTRKYLVAGENAYTIEDETGNKPLPPANGINPPENGAIPPANGINPPNVQPQPPADLKITSGNDYILGEDIINYPLNSLVLKKVDANTSEMLAGAVFELRKVTEDVSGSSGAVIGRYTTDNSGIIVITGLESGGYIAEEVKPPTNYLLSENSQQQAWMKPDGTSISEITFANYPYGSILVSKVDAQTGKPLANARFKVTDGSHAAIGNTNGEYTTDENGEFLVSNVKPDSYVVTELEAPENYVLDTTPQTVQVGTDGKIYKVSFKNQPIGSLVILKKDFNTKEPLADAEFKVTTSKGNVVGTGNGMFKTDKDGSILIPNLEKGSYVVEEIKAPDGYLLENQSQTIAIDYGKTNTLTFYNKPLASLVIQKVDSNMKQPLSGAVFKVSMKNGNVIGEYTTNGSGMIQLDELAPGWYTAVEIAAPTGYLLNDIAQDFEIKHSKTVSLTFENDPKSSLVIQKIDAKTKEPLSGARFKISKKSGDVIGEFTTNSDGLIQKDELESGWYTAVEVKAPSGYLLNEVAQDFEITHTKTVTLTFTNEMLTSLIIKKTDDKTGEPLGGAKFSVEQQDGKPVGDFSTDNTGTINIPTLSPGWYIVREKQAPDGFLLDQMPKTVEVKTDVPTTVTFTNKQLTALEIKKTDDKTGEPLGGAKFVVEKQDGQRIGEYTTDKSGIISIPTLDPDWYVVKETKAPDGFLLDETPKTVEVKTNAPTVVTFVNKQLTALEIKKEADKTGEPLSGAKFVVEKQDGQRIGEYTTDKSGIISIPTLDPDWYVVKETQSPDGYLLDETPKTVEVKTNAPTVVTFVNKQLTALEIKKTDDKTGEPLSGAKFVVEKQNGEQIGEYTTDKSGIISIPTLDPDWYVVKETKAPDGFLLDETPKTMEVKTNAPTIVTFVNKQLTALEIKKEADKTGEPLSGAKFVVEKQDGQRIGEYTTDKSGIISIPALDPDWYVVKETQSPDGYLLDEIPKTVEVKTNAPTVVTFVNRPLASLQIKKVDEITGAPLSGASFKVIKQNGEMIGEYTTEKDGFINVPTLAPGHYSVSEMKAPDGYILDSVPKTVEIVTGRPTSVTFSNKPLSGLKIIKLDSVTREPLEGVEFAVAKMNGEKVGNFKTDNTGQIYISELSDGYYTVTEIKGLEGYISDKEPKTVQIQWGKPTILEITNEPYPALIIKKTAGNNGKPLEGVKFMVAKPNGEQIGIYKTDKSGRIEIEGLEEGRYIVTETETVKGYELDSEAKEVIIKYGKRTVLEVTNDPLSSIIIRKIDSVTKEGIYGVTFLLYDEKDNPLGQFISDNEGYVWLDKELEPGKYKLRELKPAEGYLPDDVPRTIYVKSGQTTEIIWENTSQNGQIVITKRSSDFNAMTGLPAGSPLAGASFEIYNTTGNLVDKMVSDNRGIAGSKPLPTGVYVVKEVSAPRYYAINSKELLAEIRHNGDIVKFEFLNSSIMLDLTVQKKGPNQAAPGQTIMYELFEIANQSSGKLDNFYIHDRIPTDATRVTKVVTGTYNERMYYKITYKTNYKDYRTLAENLLTKNSYEYSLHPNALGLAAGEYVTDVRLEFPQASPGFKSENNMFVFCEVMPTVPRDYKIVNRADVGGRYGNEWESKNTSWNTSVWAQDTPRVPLPKTGY